VKGTARGPVVTLVSNPEVPADEKLSWLVLGRTVDPNNKSDLGMLQAAAAALLSRSPGSPPPQRQIARALGLDEIGLASTGSSTTTSSTGSGGVGDQVVAVSKRLSERIYVTYGQGLSTAARVIRFNVNLTQRLTLRVEGGESTGATTSGVDLFYSFSFD
jgi:translocation and assembly module TamB